MGLFPSFKFSRAGFVLYFCFAETTFRAVMLLLFCGLIIALLLCEFWLLVAIQLAFASLGFCNIATVIIARHALLSALYFSYFCCNYCSFLISTKRE